MEKVNIFIVTIISMKDNGKMIKSMDMEFIIIKIKVKNIKDNSKMDQNKVMEFFIIAMVINTKEIIIMVISMEKELLDMIMEID